jgi:hypothetical protein
MQMVCCPNWKFERFWHVLFNVRYQTFRRSWDDKSLSPAGIEPPFLSRPARCPAPADCGPTWPSPFPLYQLFALLPAGPLETLTSFFQLSAFTRLPVMKGGRRTPGELMKVSIATQSFRYEILPDVWACTLCAPHTVQTAAIRLVYSFLYRRRSLRLRLVTSIRAQRSS